MRNLFYLLFFSLSLNVTAQTEADTITNWQLYKDTKLILKSYYFDSTIHTAIINKTENFEVLKLYINNDVRGGKVKRKLLFRLNGKLIYSFIKDLKSGADPLIITKKELYDIIGPNINKTFAIDYTDDTKSNGNLIGLLIVTDK